ncbi:Ribosomal RNA small subunit methyltransferase E [Phycisphaerae bacterium RAS1]|nr:Ribosomal RNA small subunit methyltransferase E [Phycisphaerae bacterium RAS1]
MTNAPRFFCDDIRPGSIALCPDESRHARRSLRLQPGDAVELFDGRGNVGYGHLSDPPAHETAAAARGRRHDVPAAVLVAHVLHHPPPPRRLSLIVAAPKGDRLEWMIEKCTELGAWKITLAEFERSVVHLRPAHAEKLSRTAVEACKQSRRPWRPQILAGVCLPVALTSAVSDGVLLCADPSDTAQPLGRWLREQHSEALAASILIGPEGGLTADETGCAAFQHVRLAAHTLRIETAAVAAAAAWAMH